MSEDSRSRHDDGKLLYCSFCGKSQHEVRKLIAGPSVFVCDECVELCNDIIREELEDRAERAREDRKSTRLNSSHLVISYAVFCLKKKNLTPTPSVSPTGQ